MLDLVEKGVFSDMFPSTLNGPWLQFSGSNMAEELSLEDWRENSSELGYF